MKKTKLLLLAALLIGIGSAFTNVKPVRTDPVYGTPDNGVNWYPVNEEDENETYICDTGDQSCVYEDESFDHPIGPLTKKFQLISQKSKK